MRKHEETAVVIASDPEERSRLAKGLEVSGLQPRCHADTGSALPQLSRPPAPRLVVAQAYGPGIDGPRLCRWLRSSLRPLFDATPILAVVPAALTLPPVELAALLPADDWIFSPVDPAALSRTVHALLERAPPAPRPRALLISPDETLAASLAPGFEARGWSLTCAPTAADVPRLLASFAPHYVLLEDRPPDCLAEPLLRELPADRVPTLVVAADADPSRAAHWLSLGAAGLLPRASSAAEAIALCEQVARESGLRRLVLELQDRTGALERSQACQRLTLEALPAGFARFRALSADRSAVANYLCLEADPACAELTGFSSDRLVGHPLSELIPGGFPALGGVFADVESQGKPVVFERFDPRAGRHTQFTAFRLASDQYGVVLRDITARKQAEDLYLRAQRTHSLGALTAGIAHDLNNLLGPIHMAVPLLGGGKLDEADRHTLIQTVGNCTSRGIALVKQLLAFGRGAEGERRDLDPGQLLADIVQLARETFPHHIKIQCEHPNGLWPIRANATQVHQVLLNLCVNARDAMPAGGVLRLSAENARLDAAFLAPHPRAAAGPFVVLRVSDTGTGIAPEIAAKLFTPYFTTKKPGDGTGLGLATVLHVAQAHRGCVDLTSQPGQGTEFRVYFPALEPAAPTAPPLSLPPGGARAILLILVATQRQELKDTLEAHGYRVLAARSGTHALALARRHVGELQLVLADPAVRCLGQVPAARAFRELDPHTPLVLLGQADDPAVRALNLEPQAYLPQPVALGDLAHVFRTLLPR